jgi:phosphoglycolate phosphatase
LSVAPQQTVYVGDHIRDIEAGRAAGNYTIAATWGYLHADEDVLSWKADLVLHTPQELLQQLSVKLRN